MGSPEATAEQVAATAEKAPPALNRLIAALRALADRNANHDQVKDITQAWQSGEIQLDQAGGAISGTSVSIDGDSNAAIIVGHGNLVLNASSALATLLLQLVQAGHPPRLHQLPPEEVNFHGRQTEERDLIAALRPGSVASICALNGMGGIGKSALAARVGRRVAQLFPDAQLWVLLDGSRGTPLPAAEAMKRVIRSLEPLVQIPESEQEVEGLYRHLLHERRCLIVFDDARDANQVRPLLPPAPSAALITSRQTITLGGTRIRLDALSLSEAVAVLRQILAGHDIAEAELKRLAEGCHRLPLALQAAGTFLAENQAWTVTRYLDAMPDQRRRMTDLFRHANDETLDVYAVLGLSVERLQEATLDKAGLWRQLAVFPATFDTAAAAAVWGSQQEDAGATLDDLVRRTLVEMASRSDMGARYRLHDFLSDLAKAELDGAAAEADLRRPTAERRFAEHYKSVLLAADDLYLQGGSRLSAGLALYDLEADNILHGHGLALARIEDSDPTWAQLVADYANAGVSVLFLRLPPRARLPWLEAQRTACVRLGHRGGEAAALGNIGMAYRHLGEAHKAIEFYEQHLEIARELGDRRGEGNDLRNMGIAYADLGEARKAIEFYEQSLVISREIGNRRGIGNDLGNMGVAYAALGEARKAVELNEQWLEIAREIGDRNGEGNALGNIGVGYAELGEARKAIEFYEQLLTIAREIGDRRGEGAALGNMGVAYAALGEARKAIEFHEQQLTIAREIGDRRGEGNALGNMAGCLGKIGESADAAAKLQDALTIFIEIESPHAHQVRAELEQMRQES